MRRFLSVVASVLVLSGCDAGFSGAPKDSIAPDRSFDEVIINGTLDKSRLQQLAQLSFVDMNTRNAVIEARMAEIDVLYFEYENNISAEVRRGNFLTSMAGILVGAVGAQVSGGTSQQLSALSGVIAGGSSAYQKEVLLDRSIQAFISQMRANRNTKKAEILAKLDKPGTAYTLQGALSDLAEYRQAGTLSSAIAGITEKAQNDERVSDGNLVVEESKSITRRAAVNRQPLASTASSRNIMSYLSTGNAVERASRRAKASECLQRANVADKPTSLDLFVLNQGQYDLLARSMALCLGL